MKTPMNYTYTCDVYGINNEITNENIVMTRMTIPDGYYWDKGIDGSIAFAFIRDGFIIHAFVPKKK